MEFFADIFFNFLTKAKTAISSLTFSDCGNPVKREIQNK